jgi:hypothetical protein
MFQIDKTKCSYLGGLIDGEGNICIWRTEARSHDFEVSGKTYGSFNLRLHIANTSVTLMKWLISNFGGVYHCKREATDKHKAAYEWRPKGENNTKRTLLAVLPYLVIKREQAILALKYIELPRNCPKEREPLYQRMRELNQKGPSTVTTNTQEAFDSPSDVKIESELIGDDESAPDVNQGLDYCSKCREYLHDEMGHMCPSNLA